jgi:hypothetical protein
LAISVTFGCLHRHEGRPAKSARRERDLLQWATVPWCVSCNKFMTPPTVTPDGNCPRCGRPVERGLIPGMTRSADEPKPAVPWHLKLFGTALALYLGFRFVQIIDWVFHR